MKTGNTGGKNEAGGGGGKGNYYVAMSSDSFEGEVEGRKRERRKSETALRFLRKFQQD